MNHKPFMWNFVLDLDREGQGLEPFIFEKQPVETAPCHTDLYVYYLIQAHQAPSWLSWNSPSLTLNVPVNRTVSQTLFIQRQIITGANSGHFSYGAGLRPHSLMGSGLRLMV